MTLILRGATAAVILFTTWSARCGSLPDAPDGFGLVVKVHIEPAEPRQGETIRIVSEVTNRGREAESGTFAMCGLGVTGSLALTEPIGTARCAGVSYEKQIQPGETEAAIDTKVVDSPAGTYVLEVHHLIHPQQTPAITVNVRD